MEKTISGNFWHQSNRMKVTATTIDIEGGKTLKGFISPEVSPTNGMLKAVEKLMRDILTNGWTTGLAVDENGLIWSKSVNHDPSQNEDMVVCLDAKARKLSLAKVDSTGAMKAYDETNRCPYEVLLTVIGYLWNEKSIDFSKYSKESFVWDSQTDIKTLINEYKSTGKLTKTQELASLLAAIYIVGSKIMPTAMDDFEELRVITKQGTDLTKEMFPKNSAAEFFDTNSVDWEVKDAYQKGAKGFEITEALMKKYSPSTQEWRDNASEAEKALIPTAAQIMDYIPDEKDEIRCKLIDDCIKNNRQDINILLWGPPGNGKSAKALFFCYVFQLAYYFEQGYDSKDAGDYAGTTIATNGTLHTSCETAFVKAIRDGGVFVDDDFNYGKAGEQIFKNSVLEKPYVAKLANQTEIRRNRFCIYIATANPNCSGAREIPSAFRNRFYIDEYIPELEDEYLKMQVMNTSKLEDDKMADTMIESYHLINEAIGRGLNKVEEAENLTPRDLTHWAERTVSLGGCPKLAAEFGIYGALGENASEEFLKKVRETIIGPRFKK